MKPYIDDIQFDLFDGKKHIRTFDNNVDSDELVWHRDKKNRTVRVIRCKDWKIQFDNELPNIMDEGDIIKIKKEVYHRLHRGKGKLVLEIKENE